MSILHKGQNKKRKIWLKSDKWSLKIRFKIDILHTQVLWIFSCSKPCPIVAAGQYFQILVSKLSYLFIINYAPASPRLTIIEFSKNLKVRRMKVPTTKITTSTPFSGAEHVYQCNGGGLNWFI